MKLPVLLAAAALAICLTGCSHVQTDATPSATSETAGAAATATPAATPATSAEPVCAEVGTILPETADAGRSYVDETLFIGDSNTARYLLYANETGTAFTSLNNNIGVVSMGVGSITSLKCEKFKGSSAMYTVPDAVAMLKPKRIIICYGTNNLSGSSTDATNYIKTYLQGLQAIQTAWPYCDIIVSAIPPLDRQRENTNLTMTQVDAYNAALVQMCEENGFKFLNSAEVLRDDATGWAKKDYTLSDGVHLSKEAVTAYFTYVRTHAYAAEDRRPQPLGTIPTPDGVPANLINKDPIAVRGAKVPLEFVAANGGKLSGTTSQLVKKGGTVAENIAYGRPGATRAEIEEAARLAGADAFVRALKDGYDTYVGERGVKLSGGQKQRLAIARVFLKNPRILLLDEATSALDNESEILVGQSLDKLAKGRTTLTIAHRLTTIKNVDRILVLGRDGIEEEGSHDELLAKQGVYYRLWNGLVSGETL